MIVGSSWILRQGVKQTLRRLELLVVGEGEQLAEACVGYSRTAAPTLVLSLVGQAGNMTEALNVLRLAGNMFHGSKRVILADEANAKQDTDVAAALQAGIDALLSSKLSSRMLVNSLQLVLLNHKLFATLPDMEVKAAADSISCRRPPPQRPQRSNAVTPASQVVQLKSHLPARSLPITAVDLVRNRTQTQTDDLVRAPAPSEREWEILRCLASGKSNKSTARELDIAEATVKVHVKSLLRKLGVANRTQAAIWWFQQTKPVSEFGAKIAGEF